jgi:hypothetical protein
MRRTAWDGRPGFETGFTELVSMRVWNLLLGPKSEKLESKGKACNRSKDK